MIAALNSFLNGFSLVSLGDAVADQTTADSGANRDSGGRSIAPGDRTLAPQRESVLATRPSGQTYSGQPFDDSPSRTPALGDIFPYRGGGAGSSPYIGGSNPANTVGAGSDSPTPLYGDADPFRILADVFARGGFGATPEQQPLTQYVPLTGGGGGSSAGIWIVLLLAVAGGAYYFLVYKKGGA